MLCDECKKRPASVQITKVVNGNKTQHHLCEECAGVSHQALQWNLPQFGIFDLLSGLVPHDNNLKHTSSASFHNTSLKCPVCHQTYDEFVRNGRFGCSDCYEAFGEQLELLIRKIHGAIEHSGKLPKRAGSQIKVHREIKRLRDELNLAVKREEYEKAAGLRDKIKELEGLGGA